jgi:hypothetical protein
VNKYDHPALQALSDDAWLSLLCAAGIADEHGRFRLDVLAAQTPCVPAYDYRGFERAASGYVELESTGMVRRLVGTRRPQSEIWLPHWRAWRGTCTECVYFLQSADGPVKIGRSKTPQGRARALQTGNPHQLTMLGSVVAFLGFETALHRAHAADRIQGEWFRPSPAVLETIDRLTG